MMFVGAAVGGVTMAWVNDDRPLSDVVKELSVEMTTRLCTGVRSLLQGWVWPSLEALQTWVLQNEKLLNQIADFIRRILEPQFMVVGPR